MGVMGMDTGSEKARTARRRATRPMDAPQLLVGRILGGQYRLDGVLNAGGMGIIFEATQLSIDRRVAVKVLKPTLSRDPSLVERFQLEVEVVAQISHPNVVKLIDSGGDDTGLIYLVMEFVEGKTLRQALRGGELKLWEILEVFSQVCTALIEIHGQQIIHRDLKFDNIMISRMRDGRIHVQLLDFGVAKLLSRDINLTEGGQVAGTPGIVAPELVDGEEPSVESDLYSMGVLIFTTLAGRAPFSAENDLELMRAHKVEPLPNLREMVGQRVPEEIVDLTMELLAKDRSLRPGSAMDVRRRLDNMSRRIRDKFPDATAYIPPDTQGLQLPKRPSPDLSVLEAFDESRAEDSRGIKRRFSEPRVAPMTVVAALSLLLMILAVALIYVVFVTTGSG